MFDNHIPAGVEEPLPGIWSWGGHSPAHKVELHAHAIASPDGWLIVDPLPMPSEAAKVWQQTEGRWTVLFTNGNHWRDGDAWRALPDAELWALPGAGLPCHPLPAHPGAGWSNVWEVWPLPGGAPGEIALIRRDRSLAVFGDAVVNLRARGLEILPDRYCENPSRLRQSLSDLPDFEQAVMAHGLPLPARASRRIRALL